MKTEGSTSKKKGEANRTPMSDAQGQFAKSKADRNNDGISSANPRVLTEMPRSR